MQLLGGYNSSLSRGDIHWTRIVEKNYYKVLMTNLSVGNSTIDMPCNEVHYMSVLFDLQWCIATRVGASTLVLESILSTFFDEVDPSDKGLQ